MNKYSAVLMSALLLSLAACGGGGGGNDNDPALNGTWIFASAGNITGTACSLDANNVPEERNTLTFNGERYTGKFEECVITSGNTGTFSDEGSVNGTFKTGDVYVTVDGYQLKKIDVRLGDETYYAGYNVTGNELRLSDSDGVDDGSSDALRETQLDSAVYIKQ